MAKNANDAVLVTYARTVFDKFGGPARSVPTCDLIQMTLEKLIEKSGLKKEQIDEVNNGSAVLMEVGMNSDIPARQAILRAGFPDTTLSFHIDRACCSSTSAIQHTLRNFKLGESEVAIVSGADAMQNLPLYIHPRYRFEDAAKVGNRYLQDPMIGAGYPGFGKVAYDAGVVALEFGVTREMQDEWAVGSHAKWGAAFDRGYFDDEYFPIVVPQGKKPPLVVEKDQQPRPGTNMEALSKLPTVYDSPTVTAGNAPGINTGAAGMILTTRAKAEALGLKPIAKIICVASIAEDEKYIATVPAGAIKKGLAMADLTLNDVELIEINEAFAAMPLVSTKVLSEGDDGKWKHLKEITNVNGGAVAIGHPIGASGIRITTTLIRELKARGGRYGVAAICGGLAQGDAVVVEIE